MRIAKLTCRPRCRLAGDQPSLDPAAVAMIATGRVVITVAFIAYPVAGPVGAIIADAGPSSMPRSGCS